MVARFAAYRSVPFSGTAVLRKRSIAFEFQALRIEPLMEQHDPRQFSDGIDALSTTSASTGAVAASSFSPSCS